MATLYTNGIQGTLSAGISNSDTSITSAIFASLPTVSGGDIVWLVLDPEESAGEIEIVQVTAHSSASTSVTVTRGAQGTSARTHASGITVANAVTATDLSGFLTEIADDAVTTAKILDANVTSAKIAGDAIDGTKIADDAVAAEHLADDSVGTAAIAATAVTATELGSGAVTTTKLADDAVTTAKLADSAVTEAKIADGSVTEDKLSSSFGYTYKQTVLFTSSGTFTKASYPWLRLIRATIAGAGGGGAGAGATSASEAAGGGGGGGGAVVTQEITDIAGLGTNETITIGAGGSGGSGNANGSDGGNTSAFGSIADGGGQGVVSGPVSGATTMRGGTAGAASSSTSGTGVLTVTDGAEGEPYFQFLISRAMGGEGGRSPNPFSKPGSRGNAASVAGTDGGNGSNGGGGGGAANRASQTAKDGGDGGDGIVILELYA